MGLKRETIKQIRIIFLFILICTFIPCKAPETEWQRTVGEENGIRFIGSLPFSVGNDI